MTSDGKLPGDWSRASDVAGERDTGVEEGYRPYRRASPYVPRPWERPPEPRPTGRVAPRLYWFAPRSSPARRLGKGLAVVTVLALAAWSVRALRDTDGAALGDLRQVTSTLIEAVPRLVEQGREAVPAIRGPRASGVRPSAPEGPPLPRTAQGGAAVETLDEVDDGSVAAAVGDVAPVVTADAATADPPRDAETPATAVEDSGSVTPEPEDVPPAPAEPRPTAGTVETAASPPPAASAPSPAPPSPAVPEPAPSPGTLFLQTYPWGRVYVDGAYVGNTPLISTQIPAGPHWIRVERPGYEPHAEYVVVEPGQPLRLTGIILKRGLS